MKVVVPSIHDTFHLLKRLWFHIGPKRRRQLVFLLVLAVLTSFAEIVSIGAVLPFLAVLTAPERIYEHPAAKPFIDLFGLTDPGDLLLPLTVAFGLAALLSGVMRLALLWANTRLSFAIGADLGINIFHRTLYQTYANHVARNSSELIDGITTKVNNVIHAVLLQTLSLISSSVILVAILIALLSLDTVTALAALLGFGSIYALMIGVTRNRIALNSQRLAQESIQVIKVLQEGLGGIRDILIDGSQATYCETFQKADCAMRRAQGSNAFISNSPRYSVEALGMMFIALLAYMVSKQPDGLSRAVPLLGTMAFGAQRLLPVLQQAYGAWTTMKGGQASLEITLKLLDQPLPDYVDQVDPEPLPFHKQIDLRNISFQYGQNSPIVLRDLNLLIPRGSRVGFIGATGSGKSTLLDILMGLLQPTHGTLEIDGEPVTTANFRGWQKHIAHVPQTIYLADTTIEENIAFGIPKNQIDRQRVMEAASKAHIAVLIESWDANYQTVVGERGIRLSGGQRQRIGIARALYKQSDVIIFDEATSALDNETERSIMETIETIGEETTLLIIAHRLTTLKNCTQIVKLDGGNICHIGSYEEIAHSSSIK